ncbi:MAG: hypothetical protein JWM40_917 [Frankiales bacterium]|nr:hypothetical protein [Frankiales bacterium]
MGASPEELKQDIDATRADLAAGVDALAVKVTPSPTARRVGLVAGATGAVLLALRRLRARRRRRSR